MIKLIHKPVHIAPLVIFRVLFGFIMLVSILRFMLNGWVQTQYIEPEFFFSYYGFEWVKPLGEMAMYVVFTCMAITSVLVMIGLFYRASATLFFILFTYVELIDKTNYLNHYYFVSIVSLLMIWLPAHKYFSLDVLRKPSIKVDHVPNWCVLAIQLQLSIVYFYAGVAKLNPEWLLEAQPLKMWLAPNTHLPVIGWMMDKSWLAYIFSWFGAVYDLSIPFLLFNNKTRRYAYLAVIAFHILTWLLFPIGMFPFIMILATTIFFAPSGHKRVLDALSRIFKSVSHDQAIEHKVSGSGSHRWVVGFLTLFLVVQLVLPWRFLFYPGELFWTEQGYRFSWRVMLMEKAGYVIFHIKDPESGREWEAYARDHLTPMQEKQMSTQPDMILQYALFLEQKYIQEGIVDPEVRAEAYATLNGQGSRLLIDPSVDLTKEQDSFENKKWILSYK